MAAFHALCFLFFYFLILVTGARPEPYCPTRCGKVNIPYPFGIGSDCYFDPSFNIQCDYSTDPPKAFLSNTRNRSEVLQILESRVWVNYPYLAKGCFSTEKTEKDELEFIEYANIDIDLSLTPYTLSKDNLVTVVGCDDFVRINGDDSKVFAGCTSICIDKDTDHNGTCLENGNSGYGCCQSAIPKGTTKLSLSFTDMHEHVREGKTTRLFHCSYVFVGEKRRAPFSYALSGLNNSTIFQMDNPTATTAPLVLDWRIGNQTCAQANYTTISTCKGNTICIDVVGKRKGYTCQCKKGYKGNPYRQVDQGGCQDINECANDSANECKSSNHCKNTPGGYDCFCPKGYQGDGKKNGRGCSHSSPSPLINVIIGVGSGLGFILLLSICYTLYNIFQQRNDKRRKGEFFKRNGGLLLQQQGNTSVFGKPTLFTSKELEKATDHFNNARVLGQGGHGTVYKGILSDGRIVAIKKAKLLDENQLQQFINEMVILSQINHRHVVKLLGCCLETQVPVLVYEFVPNGTLFNLIHEPSIEFPFTWNMRLKIATDIAGAIDYLHSASSIPIYHRDIKSSDILLDKKYVVKVSDFGASRLVPVDQTHLTTMVAGTFGYLDPEYFQSNQFTEKSDVYSFGVVLAELLTGKKPLSFNRTNGERSLAAHFLASLEANHVDKILDDQVLLGNKEHVMAVARLAKKCLNLNGKVRPTMKIVAAQLESISKSQMAMLVVEEDGDLKDVSAHEPMMTMLSSYDYTWTSGADSMPSSPPISHPLISDRV